MSELLHFSSLLDNDYLAIDLYFRDLFMHMCNETFDIRLLRIFKCSRELVFRYETN